MKGRITLYDTGKTYTEKGPMAQAWQDRANWKREEVGREIQEGETYTTRFQAPYAGRWKVVARLENRYVQGVAEMEAGQAFIFQPPAKLHYGPLKWMLDYLLVYLWDRTEGTPDALWTPMDVYREAVEAEQEGGA